MEAPDDGTERQRAQLLGPGSEQMNLKNTRQRAVDLREQLLVLIHLVRSNPASLSFESVLDKFSIINAQYAQMTKGLRPQLRQHVAHPLSIDEQTAQVIPSQLATRDLPEMELHEAALLKDYPTAATGQSAIEKSLVDLCNLPDAHNRLISAQFEVGGKTAKSGPMHEKGPMSLAIKDKSNEIKKMIKVKMDALSKVQKKTADKSKARGNEPDACAMVLRALQGGLPFA